MAYSWLFNMVLSQATNLNCTSFRDEPTVKGCLLHQFITRCWNIHTAAPTQLELYHCLPCGFLRDPHPSYRLASFSATTSCILCIADVVACIRSFLSSLVYQPTDQPTNHLPLTTAPLHQDTSRRPIFGRSRQSSRPTLALLGTVTRVAADDTGRQNCG